MKILALIFSTVLFASIAQETSSLNTEPSPSRHALGLHAGVSTGQGFSYRFQPNKWGVQITGIPIFNGDNGYYASTGISILYKIKEHEKVDLFAYFGNHLIFERYQEYIYQDPWQDPWVEPELTYATSRRYNVAVGAGINVHLWSVLDLSLQAGYGLSTFNNFPLTTVFAGEIGLYYKF